MTLSYAYTPQIWLPAFTALVLIVLAVYSFRRRSVPGALPITIAILIGALWMVGNGLEVSAVDTITKIFWIKYRVAWMVPLTTAVTCFLLDYAWPGRWLTRRNLALLSIPCLLNVGMILTDDLHHLAWQGFVLDGEVIPLNGVGNLIFLGYVFVLGLSNLIVLAWLFIRSPQHRWPAALMMTGLTAVRVVYALDAVQVIHSDLPIEVIIFWFQIPMYMIALFGFRILNPIPLARQTVIEQLCDGMLILNPQGQLVTLNPAAEKILGSPLKQVQGKPVSALLPGLPELSSPPDSAAALSKLFEMKLRPVGEERYYEINFSPLDDFRGLSIGHLLIVHDVTEQRQYQAQFLEQQRAMVMLHEREQLARELHDNLSQTLGFTGIQLEAAIKMILDGKVAAGMAQLNRLVSVVREAHTDLRENILDLHTAPVPQQPFFTAIRRYLEGFSDNYGIQTSLGVDERLGEQPFPQDVRMQVFRILQESLSNARKHAQAHCVQVSFAWEDHLIRMTVQDDGAGFNPTLAAGEGHFGLKFMRERAEALGGSLQVESSPGEGTRVILEIPVNRQP